jgi:hypothetical protein
MENNDRLAEIQRMFDLAVTEDGWDMESEILYSFFFVGTDPEKLEKLGDQLAEVGFEFVDIFQLGDEETSEPTGEFLLHIDQAGIYTPENLEKQLKAFEELCAKEGYAQLDGWEFGDDSGDEEDEDESEIAGLDE